MLRCQCPSVCPSVCDESALAHYSYFRFQIPITIYRALRSRCMRASDAGASTELFIVHCSRGKRSSPGRVEGSSRAMLTTARLSCFILYSTSAVTHTHGATACTSVVYASYCVGKNNRITRTMRPYQEFVRLFQRCSLVDPWRLGSMNVVGHTHSASVTTDDRGHSGAVDV